jgi:cell division protein FtsW (lipid II flippase)
MPQLHLLSSDTAAQRTTQDYALQASFLRTITIPAISRLSNKQEEGSGTGWKVMLSMKATTSSGWVGSGGHASGS